MEHILSLDEKKKIALAKAKILGTATCEDCQHRYLVMEGSLRVCSKDETPVTTWITQDIRTNLHVVHLEQQTRCLQYERRTRGAPPMRFISRTSSQTFNSIQEYRKNISDVNVRHNINHRNFAIAIELAKEQT